MIVDAIGSRRFRTESGLLGASDRIGLVLVLCLIIGLFFQSPRGQETYRTAYDSGFADGEKTGEADREDRRAYDFANSALYQRADRGFDNSVHDREVFLLAYRRGFEDGYEKGYGLGGESQISDTDMERADNLVPDRRCRLAAGTEMEVRLLDVLSTQRSERGDEFSAEVVENVQCEDETVVPAGTKISGSITHLKRAGRIRGRSEMNLRFNRMKLPNGLTIPITASVVSIEERADEEVSDSEGTIRGESTRSRDVKRIGAGTGIGALIGVLTGGGAGAKIGAAAGAVAGVAGTLATRGKDIVLYPQTEMIIKLDREVALSSDVLRRAN